MGKIADKYFKIDPWSIIEEGFDPSYEMVSESVFSLGNEYMGVRGYFEEGYSGEGHVGSYFNGLFEETPIFHPARYEGFVDASRDMTNSVDWLYTRLILDGEQLDLAKSQFSDFSRVLNLKTGILTRSFIWETKSGKRIKLNFERFLSMSINHVGCQRITLEPLNFSGDITVHSAMDFTIHADNQTDSSWRSLKMDTHEGIYGMMAETKITQLKLFASFKINGSQVHDIEDLSGDRLYGLSFKLALEVGQTSHFDKIAVNYAEKNNNKTIDVWQHGMTMAKDYQHLSYDALRKENTDLWADIWSHSDIIIENDMENQQGIRFCVFQLHQTYRGSDDTLNIGAKGLSGEGYGGKAFWDTEAYCLQFYLFNNPEAAKQLLSYRYKYLPEARERAKALDCEGACYPISTIDGTETCGAWQHSSLQIHVSGAVAYGIYHYDKICGDKDFLYSKGIEMLIEVSRFYKSRVQQDPHTGAYGYYGVMGVDEFHMMINNNFFTNYLAKKSIEFTLQVIEEMKDCHVDAYENLCKRLCIEEAELDLMADIVAYMNLPKNEAGIYEQHEGFFNLPHIDLEAIPVTDFPLYHNWSYDRIYRTDMIKQPDVLMTLFMYNSDFDQATITANYDYYEPKCIHESSLSPSVHSILASEIEKYDEAYDFFGFATRLDLDNYNRNTKEGLHTTSIAAAWMNIVYGFGGMRSDGDVVSLNPYLPKQWGGYSFHIRYKGALLHIEVTQGGLRLRVKDGGPVGIKVYDVLREINEDGMEVPYPERILASVGKEA